MILNILNIILKITNEIIKQFADRLDDDWELRKKALDQLCVRDGYLMRADSSARAASMKVGCYKHQLWLKSLKVTMARWHELAEQHDLMYTLIASGLISAYCTGGFLPWEDDIDITLNQQSWFKLKELYGQCEELKPWFHKKYADSMPFGVWEVRKVPGHNDMYLAMGGAGRAKFIHHSRFAFFNKYPSPIKLRGIDISVAIPVDGHYIESFWAYRNVYPVCPSLGDKITKEQCPVVDYAGVKTRVIDEEIGGKYLDERYGTKWRSCIQPRLIVKNTKLVCETVEFDNKYINNIIVNFCNENRNM